MKVKLLSTVIAAVLFSGYSQVTMADMDAAKRLVTEEFQPSTLSQDDQLKEMQWFIDAAKPFKGMKINVVSETIATHEYEAKTLAKAFAEITGIEVTHDLIGEGDVVEKLQTEMQSGKSIYDAYINDSDLIGTHYRYQQVVPLSDYMVGDGKDVTNPMLDIKDFIGTSFTTGPDGKLYQLPDQQFANLYWFRYDLFKREDIKADFKAKYGYDLGVPVNWSAYEDIAEFFTGREIDGEKFYGHMDYGKKDPSLGWRFTDAWLSMAGAGDKGIPNGLPVDEWGIRAEGCRPVGSTVERGGATDGPAAVYSVTKYVEWLKKFAPPNAQGMTFSESGPVPSQGGVAQQIFWYTAFTASLVDPEGAKAVMNEDGTPKWRMAPSPHGAYWEEGQKLGYQDAGSWTLMKNTPPERRKAAWLYAQFVVSKTVSLKKSHVGLTFVRESDIQHESFTERAPKLGGLVEFYRSPARLQWSPTGINVPDYPKLAQLWWQNIGDASSGAKTPQEAMTSLAEAQDKIMSRLERANVQGDCGPKLNEKKSRDYWLSQPGSPKAKLSNEKPKPETIDYDELIKSWTKS
ncbi:ABC transporter substrate-binding protein [Leucothrix arctica]|uniref:ABC transporter substrate-binding protein n=1 Tax=Leucothrix arctica TaxID=1481894 RepID=A0A317CIW5_9GAMM|nr:ABC transporter substrate-binding protein [Leucothrix arctica]PWQ96270.1 ABC transporter substrate-binding protein [Leucothrix arctica]